MRETPKIALIAVFVTALITAQILAVKILAIPLPTSLPAVGTTIIVPAGVIAYAITFFASDCYTELYGRQSAQVVINVAFAMNFVLLVLLWIAIALPGSDAGADPTAFSNVLGMSTNLVLASLAAYIVSQNWDIIAFHTIGSYTNGAYLWLRNIGSTLSSQLLDTVIFILLAFLLLPTISGIGGALPLPVLFQLIVGQYLVKLVIALIDTPFVYLVVGFATNQNQIYPPHLAD